MVHPAPDQPLLPSVLDRLLDAGDDPDGSRSLSLAALRQAVRRDLETLLNTPRRWRSWPPGLAALDRSVLAYGMPDVTGAAVSSATQREAFRRAIEEAVSAQEPRLKAVTVKLLDSPPEVERVLRFRIEALIRVEPALEPVLFTGQLDPATRSIAVRSAGDDR